MIVTSGSTEINYDELATLKELAKLGALNGTTSVTTSQLSDQLDISSQTVSRRLQQLDDAGLISRDVNNDGQVVLIENEGRQALRDEYQDYRDILETDDTLVLRGTVTEGMGKGGNFISLQGYAEQFRDRLGYEPFPGTLNVKLDEDHITKSTRLEAFESIPIDEWEQGDRTYGAAECYPIELETESGQVYEPAHILNPVRSQHGEDILEVIAPDELRDQLDLDHGSEVVIHVFK